MILDGNDRLTYFALDNNYFVKDDRQLAVKSSTRN